MVRHATVRVIPSHVEAEPMVTLRPKGGMPLTDDQVAAVAAYVYTLSHH